jgi:hypothetical protein
LKNRIACLVLMLVVLAPAYAFASIADFNQAMLDGRMDDAAKAAVSVWESWDHEHPATATIAREFGYAALAARRYDDAIEFARFLVESGSSLNNPDDMPATSEVLLRAAEYGQETENQRAEALRAALQERLEESGVDMISVTAVNLLQRHDWQSAAWRQAAQSTQMAVTIYERAGPSMLHLQYDAEARWAAANFMQARTRAPALRNRAYYDMADLFNRWATDELPSMEPGVQQDQLLRSLWYLRAWIASAESYLFAHVTEMGTLIPQRPNRRSLERLLPAPSRYAEDAPPRCEGTFTGPPIRYPTNHLYQGVVGSVILLVETDQAGQVVATEVLAAVPVADFASHVQQALIDWRWEPTRDADLTKCRLEDDAHVLTVTFSIQ